MKMSWAATRMYNDVKYEKLRPPNDTDGDEEEEYVAVRTEDRDPFLDKPLCETCCNRKFLLIAVTLNVCLCVVFLLYMFPFDQQQNTAGAGDSPLLNSLNLKTDGWRITVDDIGTESCVVVFDIDEDGRQDFMFGTAVGNIFEDGRLHKLKELRQACDDRGESFPCGGMIQGRRGYDGALLWTVPTNMGVFSINCGNVDVDSDGKMDCIATGRQSTVVAFDPRNGSVLWDVLKSSVTRRVMKYLYNTYNVLVLPDLDGDGVNEVLIAHGGNPTLPAKLHHREAGRLILVSGKDGELLGKNNHYMDMPDNKETYMSPVLHTNKDGAQHVLFGHGGETIPGSLLAISIADLYNYLMGEEIATNGSYIQWKRKIRHPNNIIEIYKSSSKGVMVPPVLFDHNGDGTDDILMSAYDGTFAVFNGEDLDVIWSTEQRFSGYESYSSPAPGYFNNDAYLDFMLHLPFGTWPMYPYSLTVILDGKDGSTLWSLNSSMPQLSSDLVFRTPESQRDAFIFRVKGRGQQRSGSVSHGLAHQFGDTHEYDDVNVQHTDNADDNITSTETNETTKDPSTCQVAALRKASPHIVEVFLMDRSLADTPILIDKFEDAYYYYNITDDDRTIAARKRKIEADLSRDMKELVDRLEKEPAKTIGQLKKWTKQGGGTRTKDFRTKRASKRNSYRWKTPICTLMELYETNTGAIADFDGDGTLDLIMINQYIGELTDDLGNPLRQHCRNELTKYNLIDVINSNPRVAVELSERKTDGAKSGEMSDLKALKFGEFSQGEWFQYMGNGSRSQYRP